MGTHLSDSEKDIVMKAYHRKQGGVRAGLEAVNKSRRRRGEDELTWSPVYRFITGRTHKHASSEKRGRKKILGKSDIRLLMAARRRLIKKADSEYRVTYEDIVEEAGFEGKCSQRLVENAIRDRGVSYKQPRRKIGPTEEDAATRWKVAKHWLKRPKGYWTKNVHGYWDCKAFVMPLTPKQRKRFAQTRVSGHLRLSSEGVDAGFTKPRTEHSWIGAPSVTIAAAVAKDKVIMWHDVGKKWNGATAAGVYKGPLLAALRRTWGNRRQFTLVEDGDRKGNQSGKGKTAKKEAKIKAVVLPPRTPCWMPLDYDIWKRIVDRMAERAPEGTESKKEFLARLRKIAKTLPRGVVANAIGRMKKQIVGVDQAKGYHPKCD